MAKEVTIKSGQDEPLNVFAQIYQDHAGININRGRETEADTRANIIDRVVHEVLGWPREAVKREVFAKPGFVDFELSRGKPIIVVEAKASGVCFVLPHKKRDVPQKYKISGAFSTDKEINAALEQAHDYCSERGVRFAVVTNGFSFIIFRGTTDGTPWRAGDAIVFQSPKVIIAHFTKFWNLLSFEAVSDGKLDEAFRATAAEMLPTYRPIHSITDADAVYARNNINVALRPYVDQFFGDITKQNTIDVLKHCYVYSRPLQIIDKELGLAIRDFVPRFPTANPKEVFSTEGAPGGHFGKDIITTIEKDNSGSVILLVGGIGAGKTTFLHRFFNVVEPGLANPESGAVLITLNFLGALDRKNDLDAFLWEQIAAELRRKVPAINDRSVLEDIFVDSLKIIKSVYVNTNNEERINNALMEKVSDNKVFSQAVLLYCRKLKKIPIVVFDNVDQLGNELQTHIFTLAENFARHLKCLSILVVREETFSTAQMQRQLTAYTIRSYHLASPSFREMIKLRIEFAANKAANEPRDGNQRPFSSEDAVLQFFHLLRKSVFEKNISILKLLEAISFGDMRFALEMFNNFITSGATDMVKILDIYQNYRHYTVPYHEFAKSVILGDYRFYKEERSAILNVFDITATRNASHFTTLRILNFLVANADTERAGEGYVELNKLISAFTDEFDNEDDCLKTINKLIQLRRQLVELDTRRVDTTAGAYTIRITSAGRYYLKYLCNSYAYQDLVWQDTPFTKRSVASSISKLIYSKDHDERFRRVEVFLEYLRGQEERELVECGLNDKLGAFGPFMPHIQIEFEKQKTEIIKRIKHFARNLKV
jgi:hypothetical protein